MSKVRATAAFERFVGHRGRRLECQGGHRAARQLRRQALSA